LDKSGAERLLGSGDMLFISAEMVKPKRIQGVYISEKEIKKVVNFIVSNLKPSEEREDISGEIEAESSKSLSDVLENPEFLSEEDPLYEEAKRVVIEARKASASLLQRRLRIGYARAARLIDVMEERGVVGPGEGAKPREVYSQEENS
jgi:S-DNA-T family DNA segregation ATPase FtsK/SpoIIIE